MIFETVEDLTRKKQEENPPLETALQEKNNQGKTSSAYNNLSPSSLFPTPYKHNHYGVIETGGEEYGNYD